MATKTKFITLVYFNHNDFFPVNHFYIREKKEGEEGLLFYHPLNDKVSLVLTIDEDGHALIHERNHSSKDEDKLLIKRFLAEGQNTHEFDQVNLLKQTIKSETSPIDEKLMAAFKPRETDVNNIVENINRDICLRVFNKFGIDPDDHFDSEVGVGFDPNEILNPAIWNGSIQLMDYVPIPAKEFGLFANFISDAELSATASFYKPKSYQTTVAITYKVHYRQQGGGTNGMEFTELYEFSGMDRHLRPHR